MAIQTFAVKDIVIDAAQNVRALQDAGELAELEANIEATGGWIAPPQVMLDDKGKVHLVTGFRRMAIARKRKLAEIDCQVISAGDGDEGKIRTLINMIENTGRSQLSQLETAEGILRLDSAGFTQKQIGSALSKNQGTVSRYLKVARNIDPKVKEAIHKTMPNFPMDQLLIVAEMDAAEQRKWLAERLKPSDAGGDGEETEAPEKPAKPKLRKVVEAEVLLVALEAAGEDMAARAVRYLLVNHPRALKKAPLSLKEAKGEVEA